MTNRSSRTHSKLSPWLLLLPLLALALSLAGSAYAQAVSVEQTITNDWGNGYTSEVKIKNNSGAAISGWTLEFDLQGNISNLWNGVYTRNNTHYVVRNASWNGALPAGGSVEFGFQASYSGAQPLLTHCIFNGQSCSPDGTGGTGNPPPPPPPPLPPPPPPPSTGGFQVDWKVTNEWGSGYQGEVTIANKTTQPISSWTLQFDLGGSIGSLWNGNLSSSGQRRTVSNVSWNGNLAPGASASFGFVGGYSGTRPSPSNCVLNNVPCTFGGASTPPPPSPPTPLTIRLTSPLGGTTVSGSTPIVAEVTGDGVTSVDFLVDGSGIGQDTSAPYAFSWNTKAVNDGLHTLTARANKSGSSATSSPISVTVKQPPVEPPPPPPTGGGDFLSISGNRMVDSKGNTVRLTGLNWFGFETSNRVVHGLWARDFRSMLHQVRDLGFNVIRVPWSNAILEPGATANSIGFSGNDPYDGRGPLNQPLAGKTPLQILDLVIEEAGKLGLRVILDNHSHKPDNFLNEELWYLPDFSEQRWINDWVTLAQRYKGNPTVVGFDLKNEPHGASAWGNGDAGTDWAAAAGRAGAAIHAVHPDVLILVEGVQNSGGATYWWGGNLRGVANYKPNINPAKIVYSPHDYGPEVYSQTWFFEGSFPNNLAPLWDATWGYIPKQNIGHILVGEFGIKDQTSFQGRSLTWIQTLLAYLGNTSSWTFWSLNPNSGDTGGILQDDWKAVHQWKMNLLQPYLAPQFAPAP